MLVLACESIWENSWRAKLEPKKLDALNDYATTAKSL